MLIACTFHAIFLTPSARCEFHAISQLVQGVF